MQANAVKGYEESRFEPHRRYSRTVAQLTKTKSAPCTPPLGSAHSAKYAKNIRQLLDLGRSSSGQRGVGGARPNRGTNVSSWLKASTTR